MPFLKSTRRIEPISDQRDKLSLKNGVRHTIINVPGDRYIWEWKNNKKDGKGTLFTRSGKLYEGDWERNYRHGHGALCENQANDVYRYIYVGDWVNGKRKGIGRGSYPDGGWYEGEWHNNQRHGKGYCVFGDGSFYYGQWKNDQFHGYGLFIQANRNQYEGEFQFRKKHGRGKFYHLDSGQLQEGWWDNDFCLCSTMRDLFYRQSGLYPTEFPIIPGELQNPAKVYDEREEEVIKMQTDPNYNKPQVKIKVKIKKFKQPKIDWQM